MQNRTYSLPPATATILGGVKAGTNVSVTADGTISVPTAQSLNKTTASELRLGTEDTHYVTAKMLRDANIRPDSDFYIGEWNPNTNTPFLADVPAGVSTPPIGGYYKVSTAPVPQVRVARYAVRGNDYYVGINYNAGLIYTGMQMTGIGIPDNVYVISGGYDEVQVNQNVTIANGQTIVFIPRFAKSTDFIIGDKVTYKGTNQYLTGTYWSLEPGDLRSKTVDSNRGPWNPITNTPMLFPTFGNKGQYYEVSQNSVAVEFVNVGASNGPTSTIPLPNGITVSVGQALLNADGAGLNSVLTIASPGATQFTISNNVQTTDGQLMRISTYFGGISNFKIGDLLYFNGTQWELRARAKGFRGPWVPYTTYKSYEQILYNGNIYYANADFFSGSVFNAANWTLESSGGSGPVKATSADITAGTDDAKFTTPLGLAGAGIAGYSSLYKGQWTPSTNTPALSANTGTKGHFYRLTQSAQIGQVTIVSRINSSNYIVNNVAGLAVGMVAPNLDPDFQINGIITAINTGNNQITLNTGFSLANGKIISFYSSALGYTNYQYGDEIFYDGSSWILRPSKAVASDYYDGLMSAADHSILTSLVARNSALGLYTSDGANYTVVTTLSQLATLFNNGGDFYQTLPNINFTNTVYANGFTGLDFAGRWFGRGNTIDLASNDFNFKAGQFYDIHFLPNRVGKINFIGTTTYASAVGDVSRSTKNVLRLYSCTMPLYIGFDSIGGAQSYVVLYSCKWHQGGSSISCLDNTKANVILQGSTPNMPIAAANTGLYYGGKVIDEREVSVYPDPIGSGPSYSWNFINRTSAVAKIVLSSDSTLSISSIIPGSKGTVYVTQDATGNWGFNLGGFAANTAPSSTTIYNFETPDGTTIYWSSRQV